MRTKILYAYCPHCDYENTFHASRKYRKGLKTLKWSRLAWRCENCGKKFDSEIQWLTLGFEGWCAFWLYHFGAGFLLLREIPYAYPVYIVNNRGHRKGKQ